MPFVYQLVPEERALRQAEVLKDLVEYRPLSVDVDGRVTFEAIAHPLVVVMSQDCDLEQDCHLRFPTEGPQPAELDLQARRNSLAQVLLCDAYEIDEIRVSLKESGLGSKDWRKVEQNQNERYHFFDAAPVVGTDSEVQAVCLDFRKHFTVPTGFLYEQLASKHIARLALLPPIYSHDLIHRFFGYQSRVAIL